jgi:hypothetical protein
MENSPYGIALNPVNGVLYLTGEVNNSSMYLTVQQTLL